MVKLKFIVKDGSLVLRISEGKERYYKSVKHLLTEEPGCEVYYTNDTTGSYFPETYFLDSYDEQQYFETIEEAAESVSEIVGCTVEATVNAIQEALEKYVEQKESEGEEVFYSLHEFQVIDD